MRKPLVLYHTINLGVKVSTCANNEGTIKFATNSDCISWTKHVTVGYHFLRHKVEQDRRNGTTCRMALSPHWFSCEELISKIPKRIQCTANFSRNFGEVHRSRHVRHCVRLDNEPGRPSSSRRFVGKYHRQDRYDPDHCDGVRSALGNEGCG